MIIIFNVFLERLRRKIITKYNRSFDGTLKSTETGSKKQDTIKFETQIIRELLY